MTRRLSFRLAFGLALLASLSGRAFGADPVDPKGIEFFEKKIRPVLVEQCYSCHSVEAEKNKKLRGGLLLDSKAGIAKGGDSGAPIRPGNARESLLLKTLHYTGDVRMPPRRKLPDEVIADFEAWINQGAPDPRTAPLVARARGMTFEEGRQFWAYQLPRKTPPPATPAGSTANPIDAFIRAKLQTAGLRPAPEADRRTLVRRLYYDLVGLPPSIEEMDAALNDRSSDGYEKLVDRLLASPAYGERWGRHWLDVARFAESLTLRGFLLKDAWRYRDYVIDSFNEDVPYDHFIREQVAGDLLAPVAHVDARRGSPDPAAPGSPGWVTARRRQLIATTFLTMGNHNLEEQDKKQLRMDVVDEQLDAISRAFLAQTITCARCHDHKFDPIPTRDYYALAGILRNARTLEHANVSKWLEVPLPADAATEDVLKKHEASLADLREQIKTLKATVARNAKPLNPARPSVVAVKDLPGIVVDDTQAKKVGEWKASQWSGAYVGDGYIHDLDAGKGEKTLTFQPEIPQSGRYEVRLTYSAADNRAPNVPVTIFSADGEKTVMVNQKQPPEIDGLFHSLGQYRFEQNGQGYVIISNEGTKGHVIADAVVFIPVEKLAAPSKPVQPTGADALALKKLEDDLKRLTESGPKREMAISVIEEKQIEETRVHVRGTVHNLGEPAPRGFLRVANYGPTPKFPTNESGRVQLADWLASRDNPLTARVMANRVWHWLFGDGLVRTTDNFGTTGERPSYPELLDYLAVRFMDDGWSVKKLVRLVVMSETYRQSTRETQAGKDPENRLFSHANRRRLDAECIRDTMLFASGQLRHDMGGPTFSMTLPADYGYRHTDLRRSVYSPVFRNSLPELFEAFDFADPSVCTGRRNVSTVAPQALFLMNHPFVREQARRAAERLLATGAADDGTRIERAYRLALGRSPSDAERRLIEKFVAGAKDRQDAWAQVFQTLFASMDFRYVN